MGNVLFIFLGGGLGSICRYLLGDYFNQEGSVAWGTFIANILACLLLGVIAGLDAKSGVSTQGKLLFATGFCGGFSTFSTFSSELLEHARGGELLLGAFYLSLSIFVGLVAVYAGYKFSS